MSWIVVQTMPKNLATLWCRCRCRYMALQQADLSITVLEWSFRPVESTVTQHIELTI